MRYAAIDIGTNTILMLIAELGGDGGLTVIRDEHAIPRLGRATDASRTISSDSLDRALSVLHSYRELTLELQCNKVVVCGTSALRDAVNREEVRARIERDLGWNVRVLSGEEEALLTYRGAISSHQDETGPCIVVDIGGGSTEVIEGIGKRVVDARSHDVGAVRLTERFLKLLPANPEQIEAAKSEIRTTLPARIPLQGGTRVIGVAGTPTTIAAWDLGLHTFDARRINGHVLTREAIARFVAQISPCSLEEILAFPPIAPQRADVILAGSLILQEFLHVCGASEIEVSTRGLRYGILLDAAEHRP